MTSIAGSKMSMIIDGIAASEAIDSSGEILDVQGCDISDFENGVGVLNYEHRGDDAAGASGNDVVGKIIYAKKIFKKDDCEDKRQEAYWNSVKLPFVYIRGRLYDGAGHVGAQALAAIIRDAVMHDEPILARFSIEGSTLKKEGQRLKKTIARKVAITLKPANKSAIAGLISDPNAPKPITPKQGEKSLLEQVLESAKKNEIPGRQTLGGHTMAYNSMEVETDPSSLLKMTAKNLRNLLKAMEAGQGGGAPSTLTQGAALQREDDRLHRFSKERLKNDLRAAVRDLPDSARANKSDMLKFFKFRLPEVNEQFLDHFTDLIDDVRTRQVGDWVEKSLKVWGAVQKAEDRVRQELDVKPVEPEPVKIDIKPPEPKPNLTERVKALTKKLESKTKPVEPEPEPEVVPEEDPQVIIRRVERMAIDIAAMAKEEANFHPAEPGIVNSDLHVVPHYVIDDNQKKMVHGMDVNESDVDDPKHFRGEMRGTRGGTWHKLPNGKLGFVKKTFKEGTGLPSEPHAEVLYHNALHHLGLGKYIMPTTLLRHPDAPVNEEKPEHYVSVQEAVPDAHHHGSNTDNETLYNLARTGELQKLALVNHLFGNVDRHDWNFLFGGKEGKDFYLIDHGMSFPHYGTGNPHIGYPRYMQLASTYATQKRLPIGEFHPDARRWLMGIDPSNFEEFLKTHKVPESVSHAIITRLEHMQQYATEEPKARFNEIWEAPNMLIGGVGYMARNDITERAKEDPGVNVRHQTRMEEAKKMRQEGFAHEDARDKIQEAIQEKLMDAWKKGEDPDPWDLLKDHLGPEEAEKTLRPFAGPQNIDTYVGLFNKQVRNDASKLMRVQRGWKEHLSRAMASKVAQGEPAANALGHLDGHALDLEAHVMGAPPRAGADDNEFRLRIVEFMKPTMKRLGLRVE